MKPGELFEPADAVPRGPTPLAERMRPRSFDDFIGQTAILAPGCPLREAIARDAFQSLILWGPPGTGKTTLARIIAATTSAHFIAFSAVLSGIKDIKAVMAEAEEARRHLNRRTILFVDEIHRFNKAQQDAFLPRVEAGDIVLIGATTENPSFEVNAALLSRSQLFVLQALGTSDVVTILDRAVRDAENGLGREPLEIADGTLEAIARHANGDARVALNLLELAAAIAGTRAGRKGAVDQPRRIDLDLLGRALQRRTLRYDKSGEEHFNLISALHKSMRNGDPNAAVYWLARMVESGEDPLYIARRLLRFASEDVGNADPRALSLAIAAKEAVHFLGMPEGNTALAQVATYLAVAPKSNAVYVAYDRAARDAHSDAAEAVPLHLRNTPTSLMKDLGYGQGYEYAHDQSDAITSMDCLPPRLQNRQYYQPTDRGLEKTIAARLDAWRAERKRRKTAGTD